eukprot:Nk52_evm6s235 gene=Nk52_evmTU6s235
MTKGAKRGLVLALCVGLLMMQAVDGKKQVYKHDTETFKKNYDVNDIEGHIQGAQMACGFCGVMAKVAEEFVKQRVAEDMIQTYFYLTCDNLPARDWKEKYNLQDRISLCNSVVEEYSEEILSGISVGDSPEEVCKELDCCQSAHVSREELMQQARNMMETREKTEEEREQLRQFYERIPEDKKHRFPAHLLNKPGEL